MLYFMYYRIQPVGLVERIQAIAQNMSDMAVRVEQILQRSIATNRGLEKHFIISSTALFSIWRFNCSFLSKPSFVFLPVSPTYAFRLVDRAERDHYLLKQETIFCFTMNDQADVSHKKLKIFHKLLLFQ